MNVDTRRKSLDKSILASFPHRLSQSKLEIPKKKSSITPQLSPFLADIDSLDGGCRVYGTLKEETATRSTTVCGAKQRVQHVYTSVTNSVELRIVGKSSAERKDYFLFHYEGKRGLEG